MKRTIILFLFAIVVVISTSYISARLWGGKPEEIPENIQVTVTDDMTIAEFGQKYGLEKPILKTIFSLQSPNDLQKRVIDSGLSEHKLNNKVNQSIAMQAERATKNWFKIPLKGILWLVFLIFVFYMLRKGKVTSYSRKIIYGTAIVIFGIILGSDPSPMGTIKDAIVLLGSKGIIFPPRLIAFTVFILLVVVANKFICSWGCQFGTLQDFIFRLNRNSADSKGLMTQIKVSFVLSNTIRVLFFIALTVVAFIWATDIVEHIDPFKIYKPAVIGIIGGVFIGTILVASLFTYRPWCHFFCPFGLVSWFFEKISIFKIQVDYDKCIGCEACSKACPSNVMEAILKQDRVIPDCFACGTCIEVCPVEAIALKKGKRQVPPEGKFIKQGKNKVEVSPSA